MQSKPIRAYFQRHIALPTENGSWVFILSPLLIGLFAARTINLAIFFLIMAALSAFLIRQPVTIAVKVNSGRRPPRDLPAACFWIMVYSLLGLHAINAQLFTMDIEWN